MSIIDQGLANLKRRMELEQLVKANNFVETWEVHNCNHRFQTFLSGSTLTYSVGRPTIDVKCTLDGPRCGRTKHCTKFVVNYYVIDEYVKINSRKLLGNGIAISEQQEAYTCNFLYQLCEDIGHYGFLTV